MAIFHFRGIGPLSHSLLRGADRHRGKKILSNLMDVTGFDIESIAYAVFVSLIL